MVTVRQWQATVFTLLSLMTFLNFETSRHGCESVVGKCILSIQLKLEQLLIKSQELTGFYTHVIHLKMNKSQIPDLGYNPKFTFF